MFDKKYEDRLRKWKRFRDSLEFSNDPIQNVLDFYKDVAKVRINVDPYAEETWPNPWELLKEDVYCEFSKLLGICYTLQLTDRFSQSHFEIHIRQDSENSQIRYLLIVDGLVIDQDGILPKKIIETSQLEREFVMPTLQ